MGKITINQFLSGAQKDSLKALLDYNIKLYKRISRLQAYIDSYRRKIELIHNFFKSSDFSFNVQQFGRELKNLNLEMMSTKNENTTNDVPGNMDIGEILLTVERIIKHVIKYITGQEDLLEKYNQPNNFRDHIDEFLKYINEEASVLFCYQVKDSFEFMEAPEKQAIAQLNRYLLPYLKQEKPLDDLEKMEKTSEFVINSSYSAIELFRKLIHFLKQATGIRCIQLLVVDPGSKEIEVKLYAYVDHLPMYDVAHHSGIIAEAVKEKKVIFVNSVYEDPRYDIFDATIKSELVVPIFVGKNVYGVLNFEDDHLNRFSKEFIDGVQRICTIISDKLISFPDLYSLEKGKIACF
jgi:putative methionine-R-sulfoxide reductase with GAF domain